MSAYRDDFAYTKENVLVLEINENGCFSYIWSVYGADEKDYLALYADEDKSYKDYIKNSRANGSSMGFCETKVPANPGVELRYMSYDKTTKTYVTRFKTKGFPEVKSGMNSASLCEYVKSLVFKFRDGKPVIHYSVLAHQKNEWLGLYDRSDDIITYRNYKEYQWVDKKKNYVNFDKPVTPGGVIRYYYDAGGSLGHDWQLDAYTYEFPEIKTMIDHSVKTQKISSVVYNNLKTVFPRLQQETCYQTGTGTFHYNCIAWSLGFVDRWINPPKNTSDFIRLYRRFGYVQTALKGSDAIVDLYYNSNHEGTHASRYNMRDGRWESKLGSDIRIEHGREDLTDLDEKKSAYGTIFASMRKVVSDSPVLLPEKKELTDDVRIQARSLITVYTRKEYLHLETLFKAWKDRWWTGSYEMVSDTEKFTEMDEFQTLMEQENIVPFIIFKLSDEDNFPAIHLIEDRMDVEYENVYDQQSKAVTLIESYLAM